MIKNQFCRFYKLVNSKDILPSGQFGFRKGFGTVDALLTIVHDLQAALDETAEVRGFSLDFSSAFDLVNHDGLLFKLEILWC